MLLTVSLDINFDDVTLTSRTTFTYLTYPYSALSVFCLSLRLVLSLFFLLSIFSLSTLTLQGAVL